MPTAIAESPRETVAVAQPNTPGLLISIPPTGRIDVSDIAHLRGDALREVMVARADALRPLLERNAPERKPTVVSSRKIYSRYKKRVC